MEEHWVLEYNSMISLTLFAEFVNQQYLWKNQLIA